MVNSGRRNRAEFLSAKVPSNLTSIKMFGLHLAVMTVFPLNGWRGKLCVYSSQSFDQVVVILHVGENRLENRSSNSGEKFLCPTS